MKAFDIISKFAYRDIVPQTGDKCNSESYFGQHTILKGAEFFTQHYDCDILFDLDFEFIWVWLNADDSSADTFEDADIILQPSEQPDTRIFIYKLNDGGHSNGQI